MQLGEVFQGNNKNQRGVGGWGGGESKGIKERFRFQHQEIKNLGTWLKVQW